MVCSRLNAGGLYLAGRIKIDDMSNGNCRNEQDSGFYTEDKECCVDPWI